METNTATSCKELLVYKSKFEKRYLTGVMVYFIIILASVFLLQNNAPALFSQFPLRAGIMLFVLATLILHHFLKANYFVSNKRFALFLKDKLLNNNVSLTDETIESLKNDIVASEEYIERDKLTLTRTLDKIKDLHSK